MSGKFADQNNVNVAKKLSFSIFDEENCIRNREGFFDLAEKQLENTQQGFLLSLIKMESESRVVFAELVKLVRDSFDDTAMLSRLDSRTLAVVSVDDKSPEHYMLISKLQRNINSFLLGFTREPKLSFASVAYDPQEGLSIEDLLQRAEQSLRNCTLEFWY